MAEDEGLPDYAPALAAYHAAFAGELRAMVASLPVAAGGRVLDMACGDGVYARWLARRVWPAGGVLGVDLAPGYLARARRGTPAGPIGDLVLFAAASLERLPFADDTFDLAWCAQSLFSLPDPVDALRRLRHVVKPGGTVAVLEDDTLHQVLLPWPVELELALRRAELVGFVEESERPRKYYVGRRLPQVFHAAGLRDCHRRTWTIDRQAPLDDPTRTFLDAYLADLRERASPHLEPETLEKVGRLLDPGSDEYLLDGPDLAVTFIDHVVWGTKTAP